jgi:radical SAM protein with 4Fe4S-binding SPASM domain
MEAQPIKIKPITKTKGFQDLKFKKEDNVGIYAYIAAINKNNSLSANENNLINKVLSSYDKVQAGLELNKDDFVLKGHEINDFKSIKIKDHARYLLYRYKYNKYPELKIVDDYPPCIQIEPSSICNYRCIMCYQVDRSFSNKSSGYMGYMDLDLYKNIIDQIEGKVEAVTLASRGEPTLNKDFVKMLEYSSGKFLGFKINTNASLLSEELSHAILSNIDIGTIVFSIDAADKNIYEKIRVNGVFEKVLKNIARFKEIKEKYYKSSNLVTRVSGVKLNDYQDIDSMEEIWLQYVDQTGFTNYTPWETSYENDTNKISLPCTDLWRRMFVWQDGVVNPCDYDYKSTLSIGKVTESSISNLWKSDEYKSLRSLHLEQKRSMKSPCNQCPMT